jgi:bifunctional DNA-binding transcriptional regulator/antitoxin component of YhaV-PrlF toxin-antitoxin module
MTTLKISAGGRLTIPRDMLDHMRVAPGDGIAIEFLPNHRIALKAERPVGKISDAFNFLKRPGGRALSIKKLNEITARGWSGKG